MRNAHHHAARGQDSAVNKAVITALQLILLRFFPHASKSTRSSSFYSFSFIRFCSYLTNISLARFHFAFEDPSEIVCSSPCALPLADSASLQVASTPKRSPRSNSDHIPIYAIKISDGPCRVFHSTLLRKSRHRKKDAAPWRSLQPSCNVIHRQIVDVVRVHRQKSLPCFDASAQICRAEGYDLAHKERAWVTGSHKAKPNGTIV